MLLSGGTGRGTQEDPVAPPVKQKGSRCKEYGTQGQHTVFATSERNGRAERGLKDLAERLRMIKRTGCHGAMELSKTYKGRRPIIPDDQTDRKTEQPKRSKGPK